MYFCICLYIYIYIVVDYQSFGLAIHELNPETQFNNIAAPCVFACLDCSLEFKACWPKCSELYSYGHTLF